MNPYPNRPYPVGKLKYDLDARGKKSVEAIANIAMLEFGEAELLYDIPRLIGGGEIANLGHARGGSSMLMARSLKDHGLNGTVTSVDLFDEFSKNLAYDVLRGHKLEDIVSLHKGRTTEIGRLKLHAGATYNFVFVDADHSYNGVSEDFKLWSKLLVKGGWIGFHDTNQEFSRKVLDEELIGNPNWREHFDLHINRIRVFEKVV